MKKFTLFILCLFVIFGSEINAQWLPSFPGAQGFGSKSVGGRGGSVIAVTNLNDSGPGSLREACTAQGARTIIFKVAGTIALLSPIYINNPYITIAGQTVPGDGIAIKNDSTNNSPTLIVNTHDVILRHLRIRTGPANTPTCCQDAITMENTYNLMVDHCSFSWGIDETVNSWDNATDITFQWSIVSEALKYANHQEGTHGLGVLLGGNTNSGNFSFHHNLIAHNQYRNPKFAPTFGVVDMVNNVIYNPETRFTQARQEKDHVWMNYVGNYAIDGNSTKESGYLNLFSLVPEQDTATSPYTFLLYLDGNIDKHRPHDSLPIANSMYPRDKRYLSPLRNNAPYVTTHDVSEAYDLVLQSSGATKPVRDTVDRRVALSVINKQGGMINDPNQVGGWPVFSTGNIPTDTDNDGMPDTWEQTMGLNIHDPADRNNDHDGDGYTNLEEYLNELAGDISSSTAPLNLDYNITKTDCKASNGAIDLIISGGQQPYTISWNNGASTEDISNLPVGNYEVLVIDGLQDTIKESITVSNKSDLSARIAMQGANCNQANGRLFADVVGNHPPFQYQWSNGATTEIASGVYSGPHELMVTDNIGCKVSTTGYVEEIPCYSAFKTNTPPTIDGDISEFHNELETTIDDLYRESDSKIRMMYDSTNLYIAGWVGDKNLKVFSNSDDATVRYKEDAMEIHIGFNKTNGRSMKNGDFTFSVNSMGSKSDADHQGYSWDAQGFTAASVAHGSVNQSNDVDSGFNFELAIPWASFTQSTTPTTGDTINIEFINYDRGSDGVLSTIWSGGRYANRERNNHWGSPHHCPGNWGQLLLVDSNSTPQLTADISINDVKCKSENSGFATVNPTSGTPPYSFSWSNGQTTQTANGLIAGNYSVTVTDYLGQTQILNANVSEPSSIIGLSSITTNPSCGNSDGEINNIVSGGVFPYSFYWSNGDSSESSTGLANGNYYIIVIDSAGCELQENFLLDDGCTTQINEENIKAIKVYPNPTSKLITVTNIPSNFNHINIYDLNGKAVLSKKVTADRKFDVSNLQPGLYKVELFDINNKSIRTNKKLIKL